MLEFLAGAVKARLCCLISGGTGAGKTTLLNALSRYIGSRERIVTIEDSAELILQQKHVIRLECRPPNIEGKGEIKQRHLLINALRMRPDRIVLGEVRGDEAVDLLEALNTGHEGSLATIHANTPREALTRLEGLVLRGAANLPDKVIKLQIASAVSIIIQVTRTSDGKRRVTSITEVCSMQQDVITSQEIFTFDRTGVDQKGQTHGVFRGVMTPSCLDSIGSAGVHLNSALFQNRMEV
jgi:pilus assembly protein CpaF